MATREATRCTECKAPLLSAVERDQGTCTACLRSERMQTARRVAHAVTGAKRAEPPKITTLTPGETGQAESVNGVNIQGQGETYYTELVAVRVSKQTAAKLAAHLEQTKQAKAPYLRAILAEALGGTDLAKPVNMR